jgi:hypothetical protein
MVRVMVFNAAINNSSDISFRSVLLVKETESHWRTLSHKYAELYDFWRTGTFCLKTLMMNFMFHLIPKIMLFLILETNSYPGIIIKIQWYNGSSLKTERGVMRKKPMVVVVNIAKIIQLTWCNLNRSEE